MKRQFFYICILMVLSIILCVGCYNGDTNIPQCTETPIVTATISPDTIINEEQGDEEQINEEQPEVRPHSESSYENMIAFLNNVDENTFGEGRFKNVIDMIRDDGYILQPYFNGTPATIAVRNEEQTLHLAPAYNGLSEELFAWYRNTVDGKEYYFYVGVNYIEEQYLDEYEAHGSGGAYYAKGDDYEEKVNSAIFKSARDYVKMQTCGEERNIILIKENTGGYNAAEFRYDDFGIYVRFYVADEGILIDEAREILNKLSFEKVYLN